MRAINASVMRAINRRLILNEIRMRPISRAELAEVTHLTRASVTQIVEDLIAEGIVMETSVVGRMRLGRRSTQLGIPPNAGCFLGVVLGRHRLSAGAIDMSGEVVSHRTVPLDGSIDVVETVGELIDRFRTQQRRVFGAGVCASAWMDAGVIARAIESRADIRAIERSHVEARTLEEMYFRQSGDTFALIYAGEQLGAAVMTNGTLYRGQDDRSVNLGGMSVDAALREPRLGEWLSESALLEGTNCATLDELAERRAEPAAGNAIERFIQYAAYGVHNVARVFSVPRVVLAGDIFCHRDEIYQEVVTRVRASGLTDEDVEIVQAGGFNPVRMAASIAYDDFFAGEPA